jgi:hypothetical protein
MATAGRLLAVDFSIIFVGIKLEMTMCGHVGMEREKEEEDPLTRSSLDIGLLQLAAPRVAAAAEEPIIAR